MSHHEHGVPSDRLAAYLHQIEETVKADGWAVQHVFPTSDGDYWFSYTVGLEADLHVELIVVGLQAPIAQSVLTSARAALLDAKVVLGPADTSVTHVGVLQGDMPVRFDLIPDREKVEVNVTHALERDRAWTLWQIIWPDAEGRLPDHPEYDPELRRAQVLPLREVES